MIGVIRSLDSFGEPYGINFKGESTHKTIFGSLLSMAVIIMTVLYGS